jgi:hypothetical protein
MTVPDRTAAIRAINDLFRTTFVGGRVDVLYQLSYCGLPSNFKGLAEVQRWTVLDGF